MHYILKTSIVIGLLLFMMFSFSYTNKNNSRYVIKAPSYFGPKSQYQEDALSKNIIKLGRFLFYDKRLSGRNNTSCASCHIQQFAFSDTSKFSIGEGGETIRNSMALSNLLWQGSYFWDGRANTLEAQALIPIQNKLEMNQNIDSLVLELESIPRYKKMFLKAFGSNKINAHKIAKAIAQFEKTIISSNSKFDQYLSGDTTALNKNEKNGYLLFSRNPNPKKGIRGAGCIHCHSSAIQNGNDYQNNGIDSLFKDLGLGEVTQNNTQNGKFKVPSLRNVAVTAPYMHDGRFATLEEVLTHYNKNIKQSPSLSPFLMYNSNEKGRKQLLLREDEMRDIIAFLNTLTDKSLLRSKKISNPFN